MSASWRHAHESANAIKDITIDAHNRAPAL